ncbi:hypothetical protein PSP31121_05255 [Pandoraea sputorum]|uniref:Uncharacterized protein n=1 Tax=Pandoraea sputorum TaxID=93222 RepID=A0A5E5BGX0_9BURK|nr:hypothetical protein PSP31121_05255 [Pandoraea sputorum]
MSGQRDSHGRERFFRAGGARAPFQVLKAFVDHPHTPAGSSRSVRSRALRRRATVVMRPSVLDRRDAALARDAMRFCSRSSCVLGHAGVGRADGREADEPRGRCDGTLRHRPADETPRSARCAPRQTPGHHPCRCERAACDGSGPTIHGATAEPALGVGLHRRLNVARLTLRSVRARRQRPPYYWLASQFVDDPDPVSDALRQALKARSPGEDGTPRASSDRRTNRSGFATANVGPKHALNLRWAAVAIAPPPRGRKRSTARTRLSSFISVRRRKRANPLDVRREHR